MKGRDIWIIFPLFCAMEAYIFWDHRAEAWPPMRIIGAAMVVFGFLTWSLARMQLGNSFSVQARATALVTHGLYSRIRNPIYVFGSIMIAGVCLFFLKPEGLLVFLAIIPLQIVRARKESAVLEAAFGDAYRQYKQQTWF